MSAAALICADNAGIQGVLLSWPHPFSFPHLNHLFCMHRTTGAHERGKTRADTLHTCKQGSPTSARMRWRTCVAFLFYFYFAHSSTLSHTLVHATTTTTQPSIKQPTAA